MALRWRELAWILALSGCVEPPVPPLANAPPEITLDPEHEGRAAPVLRVRVSFSPSQRLATQDLALFEGELTDYQLGRIDRRDMPANLAEREVFVIAWRAAANAIELTPTRRLKAGVQYSLAARGHGRLATFEVATDWVMPAMERLWPPDNEPTGGWVVLCGWDLPEHEISLSLDPLRVQAVYRPHFGEHQGRACARLDFEPSDLEGQTLVLPASLEGRLIDSEPLTVGRADQSPDGECALGETELGPGCVELQDDRMRVRGPERASLWRLGLLGSTELHPARAGGSFVVRGLIPESEFDLQGSAFDLNGVERSFSLRLKTAPPRARVLLNEVLANPLGPEPAGEWIELYNDGSVAAELGRVRLVDPGSVVQLPNVRLEPLAYALLVREDFQSGAYDVPPHDSASLIRLPMLGKNGISNAGEPLSLVDTEGHAFSAFPPVAARVAGVSIARVNLDAPDDLPSAFVEHAAPGASPGAENQVRTDP